MEPTIEKQQAQIYKIRNIRSCWADIILDIDKNGQSGALIIRSDYGSWNHYWSSPGKPFKHFLIGISEDNLTDKLLKDGPMQFDGTLYLKKLKDHLASSLADKEITENLISEINIELEEIEQNAEESNSGFYHYIQDHCPITYEYLTGNDLYSINGDSVPRLLVRFINEAWPHFIKCIKQEELEPALNSEEHY